MQKTPYYSYKLGTLPKGCQLCVKGSKLVMFITGLCPRCCYFCPISDKKYQKDVIYADEWPITDIKEAIKEAKLINAEGAGITGGDPLYKLDRTLKFIKALKKQFGKKFHIHLYTSLNLINEKNLNQLYKAGLDEIRFHLDLDSNRLWHRIKLALNYNWDIGVEIPVIPKKEKHLKNIIIFLNKVGINGKNKIKFLNLNELEIADNKVNKLLELGYKTKDSMSYAVKGSEKLALKLMDFIQKNNIKLNVHYCTAQLKDKVQLANRIKRRAKNIKKTFDTLNKDGTLTRGAIYLKELKPSFNYNSILKKANKTKTINKLKKIKNNLKKDFKINSKLIEIDKKKLRIITSTKIVKKIKKEINNNLLTNWAKDNKLLKNTKDLYLAVVTEYPTFDKINLELEFI
ncbi:MAG: radical SAM protein [Nanoarchaeota archaeon]|nr:radical SAM protein [Nanoarchaeota archaeon]MBU1004588.1 radical SAM protein [Nanoarchaeota archaeon]MBU1946986.1 radical SAM protein [Nanoarchaeota archaeon]